MVAKVFATWDAVMALVWDLTEISLHTDNPGTDGAHEVVGRGYKRAPFSVVQAVEFPNLPAVTVRYVGYWDKHGALRHMATVPNAVTVAEGDMLSTLVGFDE